MQSFSSFQKNMFLPISEGIHEDLSALRDLNADMYADDRFLDDFEYHLRDRVKGRIMGLKAELSRKATYEGCHTAPQPVSKSTPDLRKRTRGLTERPDVTVTKKPEEKRPIAAIKEEE